MNVMICLFVYEICLLYFFNLYLSFLQYTLIFEKTAVRSIIEGTWLIRKRIRVHIDWWAYEFVGNKKSQWSIHPNRERIKINLGHHKSSQTSLNFGSLLIVKIKILFYYAASHIISFNLFSMCCYVEIEKNLWSLRHAPKWCAWFMTKKNFLKSNLHPRLEEIAFFIFTSFYL